MKFLKFSWVLIALYSCNAWGMDTQKVASDAPSVVTVTQQFSINTMSEAVLLRIWMLGFKLFKEWYFPRWKFPYTGRLYSIKRHVPMGGVSCVCKRWNKLWENEKHDLLIELKIEEVTQ